MKKKQLNRRARRRFEVHYGVGDKRYLGYSRNLSSTGLMIGTMRVFPPGTLIDLEVKVSGSTYQLRGEVVWAREGPVAFVATGRVGMGVRFLAPPETFVAAVRGMPGLQ